MTRATRRFQRFPAAALLTTIVLVSFACGSSTQPSPIALTGSWTGTATDSSGPGTIAWEVTQSGASVDGPFTMIDESSGAHGRGSMTGTVSGTMVTFSIAIPAGGFDDPWSTCTASLSGSATVTASSLKGTYTGSNSCTGAVASGQLTLFKS